MEKIYGDRMHREEYVKDIVSIIKSCVNRKTPTTFSIEGDWGQGKTWLLQKIEATLKGLDISKEYDINEFEQAKSDFFIIHYNAWEKDYYEEPLLAILLTIVNELNKQLRIESILTTVYKKLGKQALHLLENVLGSISQRLLHFNIVNAGKNGVNALKKLKSESEIKLNTENDLSNIESDIKNVVSILNQLSSKYPIIFIVDELDRCIPSFAIKTLERLHHIFDKVESSVTILSICREQLDRSINQAYGAGSANHYFKKFIDFKIFLNNGNADDKEIDCLLAEYAQLFQPADNSTEGKEILKIICDNLLPREFENMIERAKLCHSLINQDSISFPYECMIAEIIIQTYWNICEKEKNQYNISPDNGNDPTSEIGKYIG